MADTFGGDPAAAWRAAASLAFAVCRFLRTRATRADRRAGTGALPAQRFPAASARVVGVHLRGLRGIGLLQPLRRVLHGVFGGGDAGAGAAGAGPPGRQLVLRGPQPRQLRGHRRQPPGHAAAVTAAGIITAAGRAVAVVIAVLPQRLLRGGGGAGQPRPGLRLSRPPARRSAQPAGHR